MVLPLETGTLVAHMCRYGRGEGKLGLGSASGGHSASLINPSVMACSLFRQIAIAVFIR